MSHLSFSGVFLGLGATVKDGNRDSHLSEAPFCLNIVFFRGLLGPWGHIKHMGIVISHLSEAPFCFKFVFLGDFGASIFGVWASIFGAWASILVNFGCHFWNLGVDFGVWASIFGAWASILVNFGCRFSTSGVDFGVWARFSLPKIQKKTFFFEFGHGFRRGGSAVLGLRKIRSPGTVDLD